MVDEVGVTTKTLFSSRNKKRSPLFKGKNNNWAREKRKQKQSLDDLTKDRPSIIDGDPDRDAYITTFTWRNLFYLIYFETRHNLYIYFIEYNNL